MVSGGKRTVLRVIVTSVIALAVAAATAVPAVAANDAGHGAGSGGFDQPSNAQLQKNLEEGLRGSFSPSSAADADLTKFIDGDLVSDAVFYNGTAWDQTRIQSFLDMKATNNSCTPSSGGPSCLNSFSMTTPSKASSTGCQAYTGVTNATAAQIIAGVGVACGINPVVLLAMIQKEQGLVSTGTPTQWMYDHATGWNCPDVGGDPSCDNSPTSTGFFNQVFGAAWQLKQYGSDPYFNYYPVGKVSAIKYSSQYTSCGTKQVAVQNKATAALYYYTPYTPNAASLANYPGEGDNCSEYGIRNFWYLFNAWYDGPSTAGSVPASTRIAGGDRFATSAAVSQAAFPSPGAGIPAAYIANAYNFPDALGAAPAAAKRQGPLLLSMPTAVPTVILNELTRLKPATIYVAGGVFALSDSVVSQLQGLSFHPTVTRVAGSDRFDTSRTIAQDAFGTSSSKAYLANGVNFPDALSAGAAAGALGQPVILINGPTPDDATVSTLKNMGVTSVKVVGGSAVIPDSYLSGLSAQGITATRVSGADRYATSLAISQDAFPSATPAAFFASGALFPDALSGAAYAAKVGSPLLVTPGGCVSAGAAEVAMRTQTIGVIGGANALADAVGMLSICQ
ncbi:Putative cell wall-binding protein OS=Leifsonia shinshuensis OX=150026 GN=HNR13_003364 PE=4 SV=1 [Leifsonia shinshuensis]